VTFEGQQNWIWARKWPKATQDGGFPGIQTSKMPKSADMAGFQPLMGFLGRNIDRKSLK
jgi:hypothetical protein